MNSFKRIITTSLFVHGSTLTRGLVSEKTTEKDVLVLYFFF